MIMKKDELHNVRVALNTKTNKDGDKCWLSISTTTVLYN